MHDLKKSSWDSLSISDKRMIHFTYCELGRQGARLADHLIIPVRYWGRGISGDLDDLQHYSGLAQGMAHLSIDSDLLNSGIMKSFTYATLAALLAAKPFLDAVPAQQHRYYNGNINTGLEMIERILGNAASLRGF